MENINLKPDLFVIEPYSDQFLRVRTTFSRTRSETQEEVSVDVLVPRGNQSLEEVEKQVLLRSLELLEEVKSGIAPVTLWQTKRTDW